MKKYSEALCLVLVIFVACSCASRPPLPPEWRYEEDAIKVRLRADSMLNFYDGAPHTLDICVYQLQDTNTFDQHSENAEGLFRLLKCSGFDGSVISHKRLSIEPGQDATFVVDRAEGARYVALVAGYYDLKKDSILRLFNVPVVVEKKCFFCRTKVLRAVPLSIDLGLGSQEIKAVDPPSVLK